MQYLRRLVWYIASRLLVITLVLGLMVTGFYYAMNVTNINVVLKDGMARRAQVIMMTEDSSELTKYFQESFIQRDPQVQNAIAGYSAYKDYNIRGMDHRLEMSFFWVWPWDTVARVTIVERIPRIDGRAGGIRPVSARVAEHEVQRYSRQGKRQVAHPQPDSSGSLGKLRNRQTVNRRPADFLRM